MRLVVAAAEGMSLPAGTEPVAAFLRDSWRIAAEASTAYGNPQSHPNIKPWGERMKMAGAPRKNFPSSIEALVRRAGKSERPFAIHPFVDFYNAVSLRYLVPAGGDQITKGDRVVKIYKGVDGEWPFTFSGTPDQSFDRAGEIFSRRSGHFHPLAPRLDIRVRLRISIGRRSLGGNAPAIPEKGRHRLRAGRERHPLGCRHDQPHSGKILKNIRFYKKIHRHHSPFRQQRARQQSPSIFSLPCVSGSQYRR